ncbi:GGDEF domain-containing protein [Microbacteriaceae bacterium K1510]|nr:GGDEF domain-containing protein [Microbacteriaceae bacterium K1510]
MQRNLRSLLSSSKRLPDPVIVELIDILYGSSIPIVIIGVALASVGVLLCAANDDPVILAFIAVCVVVTAARVSTIRAFRGAAGEARDGARARVWERRYAAGSYAFAALLGAMNLYAIATYGDPLTAMLIIGLSFGYGAGAVVRLAIRPFICVTSVAIAAVPTIAGFIVHIAGASGDIHAILAYGLQAALILGFAVSSLQLISYLYQTTLQQLLAKHDLSIMAGQDVLTGLPNRLLLRARLNEGLARLSETGGMLACHYLDLDMFKTVNDQLGHAAGDAVLQTVAARLSGMLRVGDTIARIGGDEFIVLQNGIKRVDEARLLARRIVRTVGVPVIHEGRELCIGASVGIALAPHDGMDLQILSSRADAALYQAKRQGGSSVVVWGASADADAAAPAPLRSDRGLPTLQHAPRIVA